jgi:hypothetical protein
VFLRRLRPGDVSRGKNEKDYVIYFTTMLGQKD